MSLKRVLGVFVLLSLVFSCLSGFSRNRNSTRHFIGGGVNYLKTVGDLKDDDDWDSSFLSYYASYQYEAAPMSRIELDIEYVPGVGPDDEDLWQPQGYFLFGDLLYAGIGMGIAYVDGEWADKPFYALRLGLEIPLADLLFVDINANYRFQKISAVNDLDSDDADQVTFGAAIRVVL